MLKLFPPKGKRKTYFVRGTDPVTHRRIDQTTKTADYKVAKQVRDDLEKDLLNGLLGRKAASFAEMAAESRAATLASLRPRRSLGERIATDRSARVW